MEKLVRQVEKEERYGEAHHQLTCSGTDISRSQYRGHSVSNCFAHMLCFARVVTSEAHPM